MTMVIRKNIYFDTPVHNSIIIMSFYVTIPRCDFDGLDRTEYSDVAVVVAVQVQSLILMF
jgi:hypothetical protein